MKKNVLGVKIDDVTLEQALETVQGWLSKPGRSFDKAQDRHYIVTPNPEIVVMAQKDEELRKIMNNADLAIPDGAGLKIGTDIVCHTPGIDVMEELVKLAADMGFTIGLLGGRGEVAKTTVECLRKKYPGLKVVFAESGGEVDDNGNVIARSETTKQSSLRLPQPLRGFAMTEGVDLLFVAFGPPKQEKWMARNLKYIPVKVAMGVGGAFDYLSGQVPRAPRWIRNLGLEWLFRLIIQPWRIKRQLALLKFLWLIMLK